MRKFLFALAIVCCTILKSEATIDFAQIEKSVVKVYRVDWGENITAQGTGFFIDSVSIVTNFHVVFDRDNNHHITRGVRIELNSGETLYSDFARIDSVRDVVILHVAISSKQKNFLPISRRQPKAGDNVWTVGNPEGLNNSWSGGIISSVRVAEYGDTIFQFTAPISEGSSGSPVLNDLGQVVGISTFKIKSGENLNFFVNISAVKKARAYVDFSLDEKDFAKTTTVSNYVKLAEKENRDRNYPKAIDYLNNALQIDSDNPEIFKGFAKNYLALNNLTMAESYIRKVEESDHFVKNIDIVLSELWAELHLKQGKYKEAANDYLSWSYKFGLMSQVSDTALSWGYLNAANCFFRINDYLSAKNYICKVKNPYLMDLTFYRLRASIYMKSMLAGDNSVTQNMLCSDLMKAKNILEAGSDFSDYKAVKDMFEKLCK